MYLQYKTVSFEFKVYILHCLFIHILRIKSTQIKFKKKMFSSHFVDMQYAYTVKFTDKIIVYIRHHNKTLISHLFLMKVWMECHFAVDQYSGDP